LSKTITVLDAIATCTGKLIAPLTLVMVLLTSIVVTARYLFETGAVVLTESVMYLHGIVFMLGIAYTLKDGGHVRVDILYQRFSDKGRAIIDLAGAVFFLFPVCIFILWSSFDYVAMSWRMQEGSAEPGGLPGVFVFKTLVPAMALLLMLQGIAEALRAVKQLLFPYA
ncbi:MAG: TRAP transporter small permease subunit, partial [Pseudomonadales bacterium]